jgi:peroxiredoxin
MWKVAVTFCAVIALQAPLDVQKIGPQVGEQAPEFSLVDQHGTARTLKSLAGKNGLMLVFFRSADW